MKAPAPELREASPQAALQLLGLLQRDARFIDFVEEDIAGYADADIGAAARLCTTAAAPSCANTSRSCRCATKPKAAA